MFISLQKRLINPESNKVQLHKQDFWRTNLYSSKVYVPDSVNKIYLWKDLGFYSFAALLTTHHFSNLYRVFSHDVTAAILVSQTSPLGGELFSYANAFFCSDKFEGRGPEHLEMWLIKNTWPTPSLRHTNDWPTPKARLEITWRTP